MKFRVYDNVDKKYVGTGISNNLFVITQSGLLFEYNLKGKFKKAYPDRYTVEYSTGKFDKNGKELFHSDRVIDHYKRVMICEYSQRYSKWLWIAESNTNFIHAEIHQWESKDFEIIGNIHGGSYDK